MAEKAEAAQSQSTQPQSEGAPVSVSQAERSQGNGSSGNETQRNGHSLQTQSSPESIDGTPIYVPPTDIIETKDAFTMLLDMPGATPDSINVSLENRELTVSARSNPWKPQGYTLVLAEYQSGAYERAFTLSCDIDRDRVDARYKDGVLRLTLPKTSPSPAKKIEVKSA
jgi:HSP20 family molecular chaperone IbpA